MRDIRLPISDRTQMQMSSEKTTEIYTGILTVIDTICREEGLRYFAYSKLLVQAIHYGVLLPYRWSGSYDVGMLRSDYERFLRVMHKYMKKLDFRVDIHPVYDVDETYRSSYVYIVRDELIDAGDLLVADEFRIRIAPFDKVPEAEDTRRGFYRAMKRINRTHSRVLDTRFFIRNRGRSFGEYVRQYRRYAGKNSEQAYQRVQKRARRYAASDSTLYQRVVGSRSKAISAEELFPLKRVPLGGMMLSVPKDCSVWTAEDPNQFKEQTERIQKVSLEVLREFDRLCTKIGVGYFLCGGTMLGFVRDGGFIPWDDDIDCGMLRADYEKFLAEAGKYMDREKFFLQTRESDPTIPFLFSKLRRNDTRYETNYNERRKYHKGICLDIFPFDYIPNEPEEREAHRAAAKKHARRHHYIVNRAKGNPPADDPVRTAEDHWFRMLGTVHRHLYRAFPLKITQAYYDRFVKQYNDRAGELGLTTVASFVPTYTWAELDTLLPYRRVDFEGVPALVPNQPEIFLEMQYGDYMSRPLPHQQLGHDLIAWSDGKNDKNE